MQHAYVDIRANRLEAVLDREVNVRKRQHDVSQCQFRLMV